MENPLKSNRDYLWLSWFSTKIARIWGVLHFHTQILRKNSAYGKKNSKLLGDNFYGGNWFLDATLSKWNLIKWDVANWKWDTPNVMSHHHLSYQNVLMYIKISDVRVHL
jgi:hypothetical protein